MKISFDELVELVGSLTVLSHACSIVLDEQETAQTLDGFALALSTGYINSEGEDTPALQDLRQQVVDYLAPRYMRLIEASQNVRAVKKVVLH